MGSDYLKPLATIEDNLRIRWACKIRSGDESTLKREEIKTASIREGNMKKKRSGRRINENSGKRKRSLLRRSGETGRLYEADIYIAVRRKGRYTIYKNCFCSSWPPRREDIVGYSSSFYRLTNLWKETYYPLPVINNDSAGFQTRYRQVRR